MANYRVAKIAMKLLRIYSRQPAQALDCEWLLMENGTERARGHGVPPQAHMRGARIEWTLPASQVLITRAHLPASKRRNSAVMTFAVEDAVIGDPELHRVRCSARARDKRS